MKNEKLSLSSIKNVLSRAELKKITAGSGGGGPCLPGGSSCGANVIGGEACCFPTSCRGIEGPGTLGTCG